MRYLLIVMLMVSVFFLRNDPAAACSFGLTNCTGEDYMDFCSYDDSGFWYTMYDYNSGTDQTTGSTDCVEFGCNNVTDSGCYVIVETDEVDFFACTQYNYDGFVGCGDYACVDYDNGFQTSSSYFCCENDACTTDCSSEDPCSF